MRGSVSAPIRRVAGKGGTEHDAGWWPPASIGRVPAPTAVRRAGTDPADRVRHQRADARARGGRACSRRPGPVTAAGTCSVTSGPGPSLSLAQDMLATHMPELVPTYRANGRTGGADARRRRRRRRRPDADAVGPAAFPARLLAGGDRRAGGRGLPELRLLPRVVGAGGVFQPIRRPAGDRQQRLPVGADRRDEFRRAGGVAELRRPARFRAGFRGVAGGPVPAGGRVQHRAGEGDPGPDAGGDGLQPDDRRRRQGTCSPPMSRPVGRRSSARRRSPPTTAARSRTASNTPSGTPAWNAGPAWPN